MKISSIVAAFGLIVAASTPGLADGNPAGSWRVQDGTAIVRISKCGAGFCGFVSQAQPGKDYRNPDPRKRNRSIVGIQVMFGMRPTGANSWSGQTYNAEDGQMYSGKISLGGPGSLTVEGCAGGGGPCGSQTWTRAR